MTTTHGVGAHMMRIHPDWSLEHDWDDQCNWCDDPAEATRVENAVLASVAIWGVALCGIALLAVVLGLS